MSKTGHYIVRPSGVVGWGVVLTDSDGRELGWASRDTFYLYRFDAQKHADRLNGRATHPQPTSEPTA